MASSPIGHPVQELACSVGDPFSCSACIPDGSTGTGCFSVKSVASLSAGTGTAAAFALNSDFNANIYVDTGSANTTPTFAGVWTAAGQIASIDALYSSWRPVSMGLRGSYFGNTQTDSGVVIVGQVSGRVPLSSFSGLTAGNAAALFMNYQIWPLRNGTKIRWDPESDEDQSDWQDLTTAATAVANGLERQYLLVLCYGVNASSSALFIEYVVNYEGIYKSQTFMPGGLNSESKSPSEPGWYERSKQFLQDMPRILPYVGAAVQGYHVGGAGGAAAGILTSLSNGLPAPGRLSLTGLPKQPLRIMEL